MVEFASFDFHLHTCWSYDAVAEVEEYFALASSRGVGVLAVTEHHQMDSVAEVSAAGAAHPEVGYVLGAELTVHHPFGNSDLVCLGLPPVPGAELAALFGRYHEWQRAYGDAVSAAVTAAGFPYGRQERLELLRRYRPERCIALQGVTHVQNGLQCDWLCKEKHWFADAEALQAALSAWPLPPYPDYAEVVPVVKRAGGLVFIAHPFRYFLGADEKRMDALREMLQLDGIECAHDSVPPELTPVYREYCRRHGLLSTAGSDCHSVASSAYRFGARHDLGRHRGETAWRDEILERVALWHGALPESP